MHSGPVKRTADFRHVARQRFGVVGEHLWTRLYGRALTAADVSLHSQTWTRNGRPAVEQSEEPVALFLFNEGMGDRVANQVSAGAPFEIPTHFTLPTQIFLERPWHEFRTTLGYLRDLQTQPCRDKG